jgi:hypothetical protein
MKASAYDARMPYPAAWGAVACTELHGHINDSPGQEVIARLVATGAYQYSTGAVCRQARSRRWRAAITRVSSRATTSQHAIRKNSLWHRLPGAS